LPLSRKAVSRRSGSRTVPPEIILAENAMGRFERRQFFGVSAAHSSSA